MILLRLKLNSKTNYVTLLKKNSYKDNDHNVLQEAINEVSKIISKRKEEHHYHLASKLNNPGTSAKTYWSILKTFYNGKKSTTYSSTSNWQHPCFRF